MKKIYIILASALLAVSCETPVETIWSDTNEAMLVLNAQLLQDKAGHTVWLHCSEGRGYREIEDASVVCSINGGGEITLEPVSVDREMYDGRIEQQFLGYKFKAEIVPGDDIAFQAQWDGHLATATATVPAAAAAITAVDTMKVILNGQNYSTGGTVRTTRQWNITVKDTSPEKNFYMLRVEDVYYHLDGSGHVVGSLVQDSRMDASYDALLHPASGGLMDEILGTDDNYYELFNDEMFSGASYTLKLMEPSWMAYGELWPEFWESFGDGDSYSLDRTIKIYTISLEEYLYLKAKEASGNDIEYITEPVIYPVNVSGGLGFVTAMTPAVRTLSFPAEPFTGEIPYNAYRYIDPLPDDYYY